MNESPESLRLLRLVAAFKLACGVTAVILAVLFLSDPGVQERLRQQWVGLLVLLGVPGTLAVGAGLSGSQSPVLRKAGKVVMAPALLVVVLCLLLVVGFPVFMHFFGRVLC